MKPTLPHILVAIVIVVLVDCVGLGISMALTHNITVAEPAMVITNFIGIYVWMTRGT